MANVLVVPISSGADGLVVTGAVAAALGAQTFRAFDNKAETLLAQGKSDDWFDSLVGKVEALKAEKLVIEGIYPNAEKAFLFGKNFELALSFDAAVVFAVAGDDVQVLATQLIWLNRSSPLLPTPSPVSCSTARMRRQVARWRRKPVCATSVRAARLKIPSGWPRVKARACRLHSSVST